MPESIRTELPPVEESSLLEELELPSSKRPWEPLFRYIPALDSLRNYSWTSLRKDALAGLTVATVAVPQAMAYAFLAGLEPVYGLYTAIVMTAVGALFDSSRQLINGPTNAISIAVFSALAPIDKADQLQAAVLLALLVGILQTGIALLRLGDLTRYISNAVIVGFTLGAAVLLVLDQTKNLLGLTSPPGLRDEPFIIRFWLTLTQGGGPRLWWVVIGLGSMALVLGLHLLNKRLRIRVLPEFLITLAVMAALVAFTGLHEREGLKELVIEKIPGSLPGFRVPTVDWGNFRHLSSSAMAIALLGLLEAIAMAKVIAAQTGQKLDMNQQCLSEGLANLTGSFFQCYPGSGSLTRSAINQQAGALTQWSGVICAVGVAVIMMLLAPAAHFIPRAALAGLLMITAWRMIDRKQLLYHLRATRFDAVIVLATALAAVFVSVEFCILIGVFLSFVLYVPRASRIHIAELTLTPERVIRERVPDDPRCTRILIYDLEGELFFGAAPALDKHLTAIEKRLQGETRVVVLRLKRTRNPDGVCLALLDGFLRRLEKRNTVLLLCGVREDMATALRTTGLAARLGNECIFPERLTVGSSTLDAVRAAYEHLRGDYCATCPRRNEAGKQQQDWYYMI